MSLKNSKSSYDFLLCPPGFSALSEGRLSLKNISALFFGTVKIFIFLLIPVLLYADSPPSWSEFSVFSKGKKYRADVKSAYSEKRPKERKWTVSVSDAGQKKELWRSEFDCRFGYPGGILSADGKTFIMTEVWYHSDSVLVDIYREGKKLDTDHLTGKSFQISQESLKRTASHFLWFEQNRHYRFEKRSGRDFFVLIPFDGREHWIDLSTGKKENPE